jgi:hypothetical protein
MVPDLNNVVKQRIASPLTAQQAAMNRIGTGAKPAWAPKIYYAQMPRQTGYSTDANQGNEQGQQAQGGEPQPWEQSTESPYEQQAQDVLGMPLGGDQATWDKAQAEALASIDSQTAMDQLAMQRQFAAMGGGAGGGMLVQAGNISNAASMAKAKAISDLAMKQQAAVLQDKATILNALSQFADQATQEELARLKLKLEQEQIEWQRGFNESQFEWDKQTTIASMVAQLEDAGIEVTPDMIARMQSTIESGTDGSVPNTKGQYDWQTTTGGDGRTYYWYKGKWWPGDGTGGTKAPA